MNRYIKADSSSQMEEGFCRDNQRSSESIFSLGNGKMGQRANFEERYTGPSIKGSYIAGIYYPEESHEKRRGAGRPEYSARAINTPNFIGIDVIIDGHMLNLFICDVKSFRRELNMKEGVLTRSFTAELPNGKAIEVCSTRFLSMADTECAAIRYSIKALNFSGKISMIPYIDGSITNKDSDDSMWDIIRMDVHNSEATLHTKTKKLDFHVAVAMRSSIYVNGTKCQDIRPELIKKEAWVGNRYNLNINEGDVVCLEKYVGVCTSLNHHIETLFSKSLEQATKCEKRGFDSMLCDHSQVWALKWKQSDIRIEGDIEAQQAIRYNIFLLCQTYTGEDARLNVRPDGFTGERAGATAYWETEAYCIPFFLMTSPQDVARQLLIYRYKHLEQAIENASKLGFTNGAALYPMGTITGEECHDEWEISLEEIHRNGAIAFAIHNYIRHTLDYKYLDQYGLEVLIGIARFWSQRITFSEEKQKYVMLGVTGPNEYENNIDNNWYTSRLACWCMKYTIECIDIVKRNTPTAWSRIKTKVAFDEAKEPALWKKIIDNMYYAYNQQLNIFLQQDGYMDKEQMFATDIPEKELPLNQHQSWDRIQRSCFIKQADTLQGIYLFEDEFDTDTIARHFDFYEPRTVHESSLSPCIHSILASRLGRTDKAYEMYLRTSRLDLDDYQNEVAEGCHITSMAGTWMSIVEGFGGKRAYEGRLYLAPIIPQQWESYSFRLAFRGHDIEVNVSHEDVTIMQRGNGELPIAVYGHNYIINSGEELRIKR